MQRKTVIDESSKSKPKQTYIAIATNPGVAQVAIRCMHDWFCFLDWLITRSGLSTPQGKCVAVHRVYNHFTWLSDREELMSVRMGTSAKLHTFLAKIEVGAIQALVPHPNNQLTAAIASNIIMRRRLDGRRKTSLSSVERGYVRR